MFSSVILPQIFFLLLASVSLGLDRENLIEVRSESLKGIRRTESKNGCVKDIQFLEQHEELQENFQNVLSNFTEDFGNNTDKYCDNVANGHMKSSKCVVDYDEIPASEDFKKMCTDLRAINYPVSILMRCARKNGRLEVEYLNIPSCVGRSCDSGHLYLTLISVLSGLETSMGPSVEHNWACKFYHDFQSLKKAPPTVIEIPEDDNGGADHQSLTSIMLVIFVSGVLTFL